MYTHGYKSLKMILSPKIEFQIKIKFEKNYSKPKNKIDLIKKTLEKVFH